MSGNGISKEPEDWAHFGDFASGSIGLLLSLGSLIMIYYVSTLIHEKSTKEEQELLFLNRRHQAFEALNIHLEILFLAFDRMTISIEELGHDQDVYNSQSEVGEKVETEFNLEFDKFKEYRFFLVGFSMRFGHVFKYDFNSEEYLSLLTSCEQIHVELGQVLNSIYDEEKELPELNPDEHGRALNGFILSLRSELL
jgi:hypothetical protein